MTRTQRRSPRCLDAAAAQVGRFPNFESKNELCIDVIQRSMDKTLATLTRDLPKVTDTALPIATKLDLAVHLFTRTASSDPDAILAIAEIRLQAARDPALRPAYRALSDSAAPPIQQLVVDVMKANDVHLDVSVDDLLSIMHTLYDQQMIEALISGAPDKAEAVSGQMATLLKALMTG